MEIEAKYRISEADLLQMAGLTELAGYTLRARPAAELQRNTYFDSADRRLTAAHYGLRVRRVGPHARVTLKGPAEVSERGVHQRAEYEFPGSSPDPQHWPNEEARDLALALLRGAELVQLLTIDTERLIRYAVRDGVDVAEIALDRGIIRAGERTELICELEIELLPAGEPSDIDTLAAAFAEHGTLTPEMRSKLQRGMALLDG
ncbi:MAG: CYTH domain-containing protein [Oscillochloris sp.]|nr:CYTH domain-containing protein [Oscillochloris sp.]